MYEKIMRANLMNKNKRVGNTQHNYEEVCYFVPDYVFEQTIRDGTREERDKAIHMLKTSAMFY